MTFSSILSATAAHISAASFLSSAVASGLLKYLYRPWTQWVYWSREVDGKNDRPSETLTALATNPRALGERAHLAIPRAIASANF